ncbi:hypothetical protein NFI96_002071 [Prochilodus magdalenae]|nr:hypothetical protein NFI96_002071 [Prochilodus magdalenae]
MEQLRSASDPEETEERSSSTFISTTTPTAACSPYTAYRTHGRKGNCSISLPASYVPISLSTSGCPPPSGCLLHPQHSIPFYFTMRTIRQQGVSGFGAWVFVCVSLAAAGAAPVTDGCLMLGPEIPDFHAQGEAVAIRFPFLENLITYNGLQVNNSTTFHVSHSNRSDLHNQSHRVIQKECAVWLLPSLPSDSGTYTYVFRSGTFCFMGEITVTVYETGREDIDMMSHPVSAHPDRDLTIICPHTDHFNRKESPRWYKGFPSEAVPLRSARYMTKTEDQLTIRKVSVEDEGLYTCRLTVTVNNTRFNISRIWKLRVTASVMLYPYITTPVNGSVIETRLGSSLAIQCEALVGSQSPGFTEVTWLVNGEMLENSYLRGRAFQDRK